MRILVLTLMMSFLSHSAFGAAEGGEEVANASFWGWTKLQAWGLHQLLTSPIVTSPIVAYFESPTLAYPEPEGSEDESGFEQDK